MPSPTAAVSRVEFGLTVEEFGLEMDRRRFIGPRVLRPKAVTRQSASFGRIPVEELLREVNSARAPHAGYSRGDFVFETTSFSTEEQGFEAVLDDRETAMYADLLDAEAIASARAVDIVARKYERAVAGAIHDTSVWAGAGLTTALTNEWDDSSNATPIDDIDTARQVIIDATGLEPNALIVNRKQLRALRRTDQILDRVLYKAGSPVASVTGEMLAELLDLDTLLVAGGTYNSAAEGQDADFDPIWSDEYAMLCRVATSEDPAEPCIGRTFIWNGDGVPGVGTDEQIAIAVEQYREDSRRGDVFRARTDWDLVVLIAACGHLLSNVIATE